MKKGCKHVLVLGDVDDNLNLLQGRRPSVAGSNGRLKLDRPRADGRLTPCKKTPSWPIHASYPLLPSGPRQGDWVGDRRVRVWSRALKRLKRSLLAEPSRPLRSRKTNCRVRVSRARVSFPPTPRLPPPPFISCISQGPSPFLTQNHRPTATLNLTPLNPFKRGSHRT